jgi:hypothetical protein
MTPQERDLLTQFLNDLISTPAGLKDAEAASMIDNALRSRPDAAYVLVQHAIMSDQALHQAQAEIASLRAGQQGNAGPGFLGGAAAASSGPWGSRPQGAQPQYAPQPAYAPQPGMGMPGGLFGGGGGLGSFLRTAGTTAAGVVAGDMLFSSLSGLFGGHHGGFGGFGGGYGGPTENVVINNYNDSDSGDSSDWGGGSDDSNY